MNRHQHHRRRGLRTLPPAPEGVRIETEGTEYPVAVRYVGDLDGVHQWEVVAPDITIAGHVILHAAYVPPQTAVRLRLRRVEP